MFSFRKRKTVSISFAATEFILYIVSMLSFAPRVSSTAIISLELLDYSNPTHKQLNGGCCEWICSQFLGVEECDNYFSLCLDDFESISDSMDSCSYHKMKHFHEGDDEFFFPSTFSSYNLNPINFEVPNYKGGFRLKLDVWEEDSFPFDLNPDDHIDFYNEEIYVAASPSTASTSTLYQTLHGQGYSRTTIAVRVYCAEGYYGNECSVYCVTSDNYDGHYTCDPSTGDKICIPGYEGVLCKFDTDECESSPCQNGGSCTDYLNYFTCECSEGTSGERCEIILDKCDSSPCKNDARCVNSITSFSCTCAGGFEGNFCETETDECQSNPCQNSGSCIDMIDGFQCDCMRGYKGLLCEEDVDECASDPCANQASCIDKVNGYDCSCAGGFEGDLCETDINECQSNPCQNSGTCIDMIDGFQCDCMPGYKGLLCEKDVDECASDPCANQASCIDKVNGYVCSCAGGFEGDLCETDINECQSNPCQNSGTCLDMIDMFQCNCPEGYYGLLCETGHCASTPCSNGATCTDVLDSYKCTCAPGFFGVHCKVSILVVSVSIAALILTVAISLFAWFLCKRHFNQRSYDLKNSEENESLLNST